LSRSFIDRVIRVPRIDDPPPVPPKELPEVVQDPVRSQPSLPTVSAAPHEIVRVQGGAGPAFPHPDEYYPDASKRLEEQGATVLRVCVDAAGRLTSEPVWTETSGSGRLDAAAVRLAKAGSGHYVPTTEDGRPVPSCYPVKIRFQLRNN
jgi:TonB family protein